MTFLLPSISNTINRSSLFNQYLFLFFLLLHWNLAIVFLILFLTFFINILVLVQFATLRIISCTLFLPLTLSFLAYTHCYTSIHTLLPPHILFSTFLPLKPFFSKFLSFQVFFLHLFSDLFDQPSLIFSFCTSSNLPCSLACAQSYFFCSLLPKYFICFFIDLIIFFIPLSFFVITAISSAYTNVLIFSFPITASLMRSL